MQERHDKGLQNAVVPIAALIIFTGCIGLESQDALEATLRLDAEEFERIEHVSGVILIENTAARVTTGEVKSCSGFWIERMADGMDLSAQCVVARDPHFSERSFSPGEVVETAFTLEDSQYHGDWESHPDLFHPGDYGISTSPLRGDERTAVVVFTLVGEH